MFNKQSPFTSPNKASSSTNKETGIVTEDWLFEEIVISPEYSSVVKLDAWAIISIAVVISGILLPNKSSNFIMAKQKSL